MITCIERSWNWNWIPGKAEIFSTGLQFTQPPIQRVSAVFKSGQHHEVLRLMSGSVTALVTRPDGIQLVKHMDNFTFHQRQPKSYEYMEREWAFDPLLLFFFHSTEKILLFICRGYLAPNKSTLETSMLLLYMSFVTREVLIWLWHVTSISVTVLKLFLPRYTELVGAEATSW